jgi:hypothetical protein
MTTDLFALSIEGLDALRDNLADVIEADPNALMKIALAEMPFSGSQTQMGVLLWDFQEFLARGLIVGKHADQVTDLDMISAAVAWVEDRIRRCAPQHERMRYRVRLFGGAGQSMAGSRVLHSIPDGVREAIGHTEDGTPIPMSDHDAAAAAPMLMAGSHFIARALSITSVAHQQSLEFHSRTMEAMERILDRTLDASQAKDDTIARLQKSILQFRAERVRDQERLLAADLERLDSADRTDRVIDAVGETVANVAQLVHGLPPEAAAAAQSPVVRDLLQHPRLMALLKDEDKARVLLGQLDQVLDMMEAA